MVCINIIQNMYDEAKTSVKKYERIQYFTVKVSIHSLMASTEILFVVISYVCVYERCTR